jgi:hypothetical protein
MYELVRATPESGLTLTLNLQPYAFSDDHTNLEIGLDNDYKQKR